MVLFFDLGFTKVVKGLFEVIKERINSILVCHLPEIPLTAVEVLSQGCAVSLSTTYVKHLVNRGE